MAVAPLNKFITIAVPVAPGEQTVYTAPTGVSSIVLYASVANVGIGNTYPTVTFTHRRKSTASRTSGNTRNIRVIKDAEIPPNDSLVIIDGRLVLERSALIQDSVIIEGTQSGIVAVSTAQYDNNTGITTITTSTPHGFNVNDEVTMSGLAFTCGSGYVGGLTTSIFPSPQQSFIVDSIDGPVGTSLTFTTNSGVVAGIAHTYVSGGQVAPLQMELIMSILENSTA
jgi:hypothetical protein